MQYNVLDFGAVGDGAANDTAAIQSAIDACRSSGGGRVVLPGGRTYRCGALALCSNLELHLEMGAVLKGSDEISDFVPAGRSFARPEGRQLPSYVNCDYDGAPPLCFLYGRDCENLAITGFGRIDGNEEIFYGKVTPDFIDGSFYPRTPMLFLENVSHLTITQLTLSRSAFWTVHLVGCRDVLIDGIRILNNLHLANCDGIDPDHCQDVRISNCYIECADDGIVFKNTAAAMRYGPCENITVSNCTIHSSSAAIKFGTESEADFRNILVQNCAIRCCNRGISLQLRDKGSIENVSFQNISICTRLFKREIYWGQAEPIAITVLKRREDSAVGAVRNIRFSQILCTGENGIFLYADQPGAISGLYFDQVDLSLQAVTAEEKGYHDLRPCFGASYMKTGLHYVDARHVSGAVFHGCSFRADGAMAAALSEPYRLCDCADVQL
ncbi:MAG: glycosyl hydrolase family 28 protein [Firmicutes bacterium]|nr:glycosyl hydrolase family 28 protein [Bacillota bacterium]